MNIDDLNREITSLSNKISDLTKTRSSLVRERYNLNLSLRDEKIKEKAHTKKIRTDLSIQNRKDLLKASTDWHWRGKDISEIAFCYGVSYETAIRRVKRGYSLSVQQICRPNGIYEHDIIQRITFTPEDKRSLWYKNGFGKEFLIRGKKMAFIGIEDLLRALCED